MQVGEVWTEVIAELNEEQIRPISPDREALEAISTAIHIRTEQIVEVQKELVEAMNQQDLIDEQEYFAEVSCGLDNVILKLFKQNLIPQFCVLQFVLGSCWP